MPVLPMPSPSHSSGQFSSREGDPKKLQQQADDSNERFEEIQTFLNNSLHDMGSRVCHDRKGDDD